MKKFLIAMTMMISAVAFAADPSVDEKVEKKFNDAFPKAEKVSWYDGKTHYEVLFTNDQVKCRMWYDLDGNVLKTERYYTEEGLCPFILAKIKQKYAGKKVFGVTETNTDSGIQYRIVLEDEKQWYHIDADGAGNMSLNKKFQKA